MGFLTLSDTIDRRTVPWLLAGLDLLVALHCLLSWEYLLAALAAAGACCSAAVVLSSGGRAFERGFYLLLAAHIIVLVGLEGHFGGTGSAHHKLFGRTAVGLALTGVVWGATSNRFISFPAPPLSLFGNPQDQAEEIRSHYETQIRAAAAAEERQRMARDLHDSVKQQIFVAQTAAATAQARFDTDPAGARAAIEAVRQAAREATAEMEALLDQLRSAPVTMTGLPDAVRQQCEALGFRTGARVDFAPGTLPDDKLLPPGAAPALYRVAQEALANVGRHARATTVRVDLDQIGHKMVLRIHDNGTGFDPNTAPDGMGLKNMRARAEQVGGTLEVRSQPDGGTLIEMQLPCSNPEAERAHWRETRNNFLWALFNLFVVLVVYVQRQPEAPVVVPIVLLVTLRYGFELLRLRRAK